MKIKKIILISLMLLSGCTFIPGMENPDINRMHKKQQHPEAQMTPNLIPVTPSLVASRHTAHYVYRVAPSDVLFIDVWQHPELTPQPLVRQTTRDESLPRSAGEQGHLVSFDGRLYFPLIGRIKVSGKSTEEIRHLLVSKLKKYIKHPEINVRVADYRGQKIYVLGEVKKPGVMALNDQPLSVTDAIALAGGIDSSAADPSHIYVIHGHSHQPDVYWLNAKTPDAMLLAENFILSRGDIVFVSSAAAARWNRAISQLLPTVQTVWYTNAIIHSDY